LKGVGGWDIYSIDIYEEMRPEKVVLIKGQIVDEHGYGLDNAEVDVINVETNDVINAIVNKNSGNYAVAVNSQETGNEYLMVVKKEDYSFTSSLIEISNKDAEKPVTVDFLVTPLEEGKSVLLNDIYYAKASYQISPKSFIVLNNFINFLNINPSIAIEIQGHTDNVGSLEINMQLSKNRAKAVYEYLIKKGVAANRLQYEGYGPNQPVADNDSEAGRAKNRRTEFYIIRK
jgi:outer membrane protein OmpA-like peptidoglycan-associated protein